MPCEYYKNCYAYDLDKDVCSTGEDCQVYGLFNIERDKRSATVPIHNPERISIRAGLEIMAIDESIKQKRKNVSTKK